MQAANQRLGYLFAVGAACAWASVSPGVAFLLSRGVPSLTIALWRDIAIASCMIILLASLRPSLLRVSKGMFGELLIAGAVSIGLYHALWVWSVQLNGVAIAAVLTYLYPGFVALGAKVLFKEQIGPLHIAAIALAVAGCALVVRAYDPDLLRIGLPGLIVGLLTSVAHTFYILFNQHRLHQDNRTNRLHPLTSLTYTMTFGAVTLFLVTLLAAPTQLQPPVEMPILIALALGPTMIGYALFTLALRHAPARIAGLIVVMEVPLATLIAVALLGEKLDSPQIIGMVFILTGAILPGAHAELMSQRSSRAVSPLTSAPE